MEIPMSTSSVAAAGGVVTTVWTGTVGNLSTPDTSLSKASNCSWISSSSCDENCPANKLSISYRRVNKEKKKRGEAGRSGEKRGEDGRRGEKMREEGRRWEKRG